MSLETARKCVQDIKDQLSRAGRSDEPSPRRVVEMLSSGKAIVSYTFLLGQGFTVARGDGCVAVSLKEHAISRSAVAQLLEAEGLPCVWSAPRTFWVFPAGTPSEICQRFRAAGFPVVGPHQ